ncbi:hypothetical protein F0562_011569 [Nyssa sinensis]|uniref:Uncharacterized protein n=1 Tax=Nyssa sinensis TaxID=561372 RepID=A0A5J4ZSX0_9ASTE|nr:hypothetical protein F0562_011569 [Nyssa sinensis]
MNGKKGCVEINMASVTKTKLLETGKKSGNMDFSCKAWIWNVWEFCKEDSNRVQRLTEDLTEHLEACLPES